MEWMSAPSPYIESLRVQHELWADETHALYEDLEPLAGVTVLDLGCGPGFSVGELLERVGSSGKVVAVDQSPELLEFMRSSLGARKNLEVIPLDLNRDAVDKKGLDAAFIRCVAYQLHDPEKTLRNVWDALKPGGRLAILDYFSLRYVFCPGHFVFDRFIAAMEEYWQQEKANVSIQQKMPEILTKLGFSIRDIRPVIKCARPGSRLWSWPISHFKVMTERLTARGLLSAEDATLFWVEWTKLEQEKSSFYLTCPMLSIAAIKPHTTTPTN
jgi:SAM-dependent methyltransferase